MSTGQAKQIRILPFSRVVGQEQLKLALELAYIAPRLGGVLISGQRGTGKSTAVRAFAQMMTDRLPVTLPINATEDRVVGGWDINYLMLGKTVRRPGLLEKAAGISKPEHPDDEEGANKEVSNDESGKEQRGGLLYVDEINLLDEHIVNIILDVTSTGILVVQREAQDVEEKQLSFTLVGTMNPEEGWLRPQLLDRFGLMVSVAAEEDQTRRLEILQTVMDFDDAWQDGTSSKYLAEAEADNQKIRQKLEQAKEYFAGVKVPRRAAENCVALTKEFRAEGNRGDYIMAIAARAYAALQGEKQVASEHIRKVASMALQHRRPEVMQSNQVPWSTDDDEKVKDMIEA